MSTKGTLRYEIAQGNQQGFHLYDEVFDDEHVYLELQGFQFECSTGGLYDPMAVSAGASGAIFGLYSAVFGFLLIRRRSLNPVAVKSIGSRRASSSCTTSFMVPCAEQQISPLTWEACSPDFWQDWCWCGRSPSPRDVSRKAS
jgi:hypothetical protein